MADIGGLGLRQGTALCVGAVLGPGVLALPHSAAAAAGPASIVAWVVLLALSVPVAMTFAALGARFPDGGGVSTFAGRAFGPRAANATGWLFLAAVPVAVLCAALIGGEYVAAALGLGETGRVAVAAALLAAAFAANRRGLRMSGRLQLALVVVMAGVLAATVALGASMVEAVHFTSFAPHGASGVVHAISVLFFAFAGWEAVSGLSADFRDPRRMLPRATAITLALVSVLYLGLATVIIGVLGPRAATSPVPISTLLTRELGGGASAVVAVLALALSFITINTFVAGGANLGAALARDGALPRWFSRGVAPGQIPLRSLGLLAAATAVLALAAFAFGLGLDPLMRVGAAGLAAVTVLSMAAAAKLLPRKGMPVVAAVFTGAILLATGDYLIAPVAVAAATLLIHQRRPSEAPLPEEAPVTTAA